MKCPWILYGMVMFSATGFAGESNIPAPDQVTQEGQERPASISTTETDVSKGYFNLNTWVVYQEGGLAGSAIPGNIYITRVDFQKNGSYQNLHANVYIPECTGDWGPCRRSFAFIMSCRDQWGNTNQISSPYFRNYSTQGYEYRDYSFYANGVAWCDYVDNIWTNWKYGW